MGYYIEVPEHLNKAEQLVDIYNAVIIPRPNKLSDIPKDKALICVVENGPFDAAGYCFSQDEFDAFKSDYGPRQRPRTWLLMDLALTRQLTYFRQ